MNGLCHLFANFVKNYTEGSIYFRITNINWGECEQS